jgi:hypothetical protein
MRIVEQTDRRLRLRVGWLNASLCTLDRDAGHAEVERLFAGVPYWRRRLPLANVSGACVKKRSRNGYCPRIDGLLRDSLDLAICSKEDALLTAQAIRDFLVVRPAETSSLQV